MSEETIQLGDRVKDIVTGLTGIAVARTEWLNKCVRWIVQPQEVKDGKPVDAYQVDAETIVVIESQAIAISKEIPTGGDRDFVPTRR